MGGIGLERMQSGTKVENRNIRRGPSMAWLVAIPVPAPGYECPSVGAMVRDTGESIVVAERGIDIRSQQAGKKR